MKPRIFVSTASSEFRTARTKIEHVLEFLGYEVVQQEIFGTEGGDLRQVLRDKIDSCDALVQLAGDAYGAEPPTVDPDYGRVSYTQFEFLYARLQGKKTYILFAGPACRKDNPAEKLDLPRTPNHPDPAAYQAELRDLQSAYRARPRAEGHLWHSPQDDTALENSILKLRDDSEALRKDFRQWQESLRKSQSHTARNLLALTALVLLLGIGGYLAYRSTQGKLDTISQKQNQPLDKARIRAHLTAASEKALAADLAEAAAIQGDWEKRQKLTDAAQAAHQQRLSHVEELADEFASIETGENASDTLAEMLRILDEQGIGEALAYLESQSTRLMVKAKAKADPARADLQPLLTGAQLAIANGQPEKAEALFLQLISPEIVFWPEARHEYFEYLLDTKGPRQQTYGTLSAALATYRQAMEQATLLTLQDKGNTQWQVDPALTQKKLGGTALDKGDIPAALASYTAALDTAKALAARDPGNIEWQHDLSVSHDRLGSFAFRQGDLGAARASYTAAHEIIKALAAREPENKEWQRDLSISHNNLGSVARDQGDLPAALAYYTTFFEIAKTLAASDPENTEWQRDLSFSYNMLGDIARAQGDLSAARASYTAGMKIRETLAARDPEDAYWQSDLAISHQKLGDIAVAQGDLPAARASYTAGMKIRKTLAARDPENRQWQSNLSASYDKLGDIALAEGDLPAARASYTASLEIKKTLTARDPENTGWQRDLSASHDNLGDTATAEGDLPAARASYTASLEIRKTLAARDPEKTEWQRDLSLSHHRLARMAEKQGDEKNALEHFQSCHDVLDAMAKAGKHVSPADLEELKSLKQKLGIE